MGNFKYYVMAKVFSLLIAILTTLSLNAQVKQDSIVDKLKFNGVEIDGNIDEFINKMKTKGFVFDKAEENNVVIMLGEFIGQKCRLYIVPTPKSKIVWKIAIYFGGGTWESLKKEYESVRDLFSKKYGKPSREGIFFKEPYYEGDGCELLALVNDKCLCASIYILKAGAITIQIENTCEVSVSYENSVNLDKAKQEREESVMDEI